MLLSEAGLLLSEGYSLRYKTPGEHSHLSLYSYLVARVGRRNNRLFRIEYACAEGGVIEIFEAGYCDLIVMVAHDSVGAGSRIFFI